MSELEALISKHLDGELTPSELRELRRLLASSPDALAVYREMTAIGRAARRAPTQRTPSAASEARLFAQLGREGLRDARHPLPSASTRPPMRTRLVAAASLMLVALIAVGTFLSLRTDAPSPIAGTSSGRSTTIPDLKRTPDRAHEDLATLRTPSAGRAGATVAAPERRDIAALDEARSRSARVSQPATASSRSSERASAASSRSSERASAAASSRAIERAPATSPSTSSALASTSAETSSPAASPEPSPTEAAAASKDPSAPTSSEATSIAVATTSEARESTTDARATLSADSIALADRALADVPRLLPVRDDDATASTLAAAVRYGESVIDGSLSERADDFSLGLELALGEGQRLTVLAGRSAAVTEQRAYNTHAVPARAALSEGKDEGASLQRVDETPANEVAVGKEWWLGLGYNVDLFAQDRFAIGAGARGGVGARSLRVGLEMPVRYSISDRLAIEAVMSGAYVVPHNSARSEFSVQSTSDGFVYEAEKEHTTFGTYGVSIGLRVALD